MKKTPFQDLYQILNELIDEMCELRESASLLEKQIISEAAPLPIQTTKAPRRKRVSQKLSETDSQTAQPGKSPEDKSQGVSSSCDVAEGSQK